MSVTKNVDGKNTSINETSNCLTICNENQRYESKERNAGTPVVRLFYIASIRGVPTHV